MAIAAPAISTFNNDRSIDWTTVGGASVNEGDKFLFKDMAAALLADGYGWTAQYAALSATYATAWDAQNAISNLTVDAATYTVVKDGIVFGTDYSGGGVPDFNVENYSLASVVAQTPRNATIKLRVAQTAPGVPSGSGGRTTLAAIAAILPSSCDLKALFAANYATVTDLVSALGDAKLITSPGFDSSPNLQPNIEEVEGRQRAAVRFDSYDQQPEYTYFTFDLGWSAAR